MNKGVNDFLQQKKKDRICQCLDPSTLERVQRMMEQEWLITHHESLINKPESGFFF